MQVYEITRFYGGVLSIIPININKIKLKTQPLSKKDIPVSNIKL